LSPTFNGFTEKLKQSYKLYAYVQNAYSDPIKNGEHWYDQQLRRPSMKCAK